MWLCRPLLRILDLHVNKTDMNNTERKALLNLISRCKQFSYRHLDSSIIKLRWLESLKIGKNHLKKIPEFLQIFLF